jgi:hypothetical protein
MNREPNPVILLPYDFTEVSKYAVKHAVGLAKLFRYKIMLLNIMDLNTRMYMRMSNMRKDDIEYKLKETCIFISQNSSIDVGYIFRKGKVKLIDRVAEELNVRFIVLGVDEPRNDTAAILKMVSKCSRPVFVIQQKSEFLGYKQILFPLDDLVTSRQKTTSAVRIAQVTGAKINIFAMKMSDPTEKFKHGKKIEMVEEFFRKHDIVFQTEYASGNKKLFTVEILDHIISKKCDLLIIIQRPPRLFRSIDPSDKKVLFNESRVPVLCVNAFDVYIGGGMT